MRVIYGWLIALLGITFGVTTLVLGVSIAESVPDTTATDTLGAFLFALGFCIGAGGIALGCFIGSGLYRRYLR